MPRDTITRKEAMMALRERYSYNPDTGFLTWNVEPRFNRWGIKVGDVAGRIASDGYVEVKALGRSYQAHRVAWEMFYGRPPSEEIDHINGDKSDNRISNLRDVSRKINNRNKPIPARNTTGVMGVSLIRGRYRLQLRHAGKCKYIGVYKTLDEARAASRKSYLEHGYHPNHGLLPSVRAGREV